MSKRNIARLGILSASAAIVLSLSAAAFSARDVAATVGSDALRHLRLESTIPAADTVLAETPAEVRLFFSEPPQSTGAAVRLTRGTDVLVPSTAVAADSADAKQLVIRPTDPLSAGGYTVHWRVIAQDGHTMNGTFAFRVAGE